MRKYLKMILAIGIAAGMTFSLTACSGSDDGSKSAESGSESGAANDQAQGLTLEIADGIEPYVIDAEAASSLAEAEVPEGMAEEGFEVYYTDSKEMRDYGTGRIANPDGLSIKDKLTEMRKELNGCIETKTWSDGTECGVITFCDKLAGEYTDSDKVYITSTWLFEDGDDFAAFSIFRHTQETEFAESNYTFCLPNEYSKTDMSDEEKETGIVKYISSYEDMPSILIEEWEPENADATLSDLTELYAAGEAKLVDEEEGLLPDASEAHLCQLESAVDDTAMTEVLITFMSNDRYERMTLTDESADWLGWGEAIFNSMGKKK